MAILTALEYIALLKYHKIKLHFSIIDFNKKGHNQDQTNQNKLHFQAEEV